MHYSTRSRFPRRKFLAWTKSRNSFHLSTVFILIVPFIILWSRRRFWLRFCNVPLRHLFASPWDRSSSFRDRLSFAFANIGWTTARRRVYPRSRVSLWIYFSRFLTCASPDGKPGKINKRRFPRVAAGPAEPGSNFCVDSARIMAPREATEV